MKKTILAVMAASTLALGGLAAFAHGGATGIVKQRMDQMVTLREAMKTLKEELALGGPYDAYKVAAAAAAVKRNSGEALTSKFPQGSLPMASEALPTVWTDWGRFSSLAMQLEAYAGALETAAANRIPNDHGTDMGVGMMGSGTMMGGGMMGGAGPDAAQLAQMPPMASFQAIADTCSACHTGFRKKKDGN